MSCDSGHDMGVEHKTSPLDAVDLTVCLVQIVVLSHITQDIVQTAFNPQIQMTYACLPKSQQLFPGLAWILVMVPSILMAWQPGK